MEELTIYYRQAMMTPTMRWFCRMSGKKKFSRQDIEGMKATAAFKAADRNPYSWNMEFCLYPDGSGYEARFNKCGICTLMRELIRLAKETGRDFALPYFPLCPEHNLFDALDMLYDTYKKMVDGYKAENIAFLGGSSGASMILWLMSYINHDKEKLPMPGKLYLSSPGSALNPEERRAAEKLNDSDLIMSTTALDNIFAGMAGGRKLPEHLCYTQKGIYTGVHDVYLSYGGDEIFSAAANSTAQRLRAFGANVALEIGDGMYHAYAAMPLVPEAKAAYRRLIQYLKV